MLMATHWLEKTKKILIILPVLIVFIPLELIENSASICISKLFFDKTCYGCGITRAIVNVIHFNFTKAFYYNKAIVIVFPLLIYLWIKALYKIYFLK